MTTTSSAAVVLPSVDHGLGNTAYLVDLGDGRALAVDASRDLRALRAAAGERHLTLAFAADTHLHADFVSGARQLAAEGVTVLASRSGGRQFPHTGLDDGEEVDLGGLRLRPLATPGHTDEHLAFLLLDGDTPLGVFTGGSLLVGAAARTDLVDPARTEELARRQYRSMQRFLTLPDEVEVWPTHGAGSFCSAPAGADRTSTIGREKATNPLLNAPDEGAFVDALLGTLGSFPPYFRRLPDVNRRGPTLLHEPLALAPLDVGQVQSLLAEGAEVVDVRTAAAFAAGHVPGALSIPLRPVFATWLGWLAPHDRPIVVLRAPDQDPAEVAWQAAKVGYDNLAGELSGGWDSWVAAGLPTASLPQVLPDATGAARVLDVRQRSEYTSGHVPGALHIELGSLASHLNDLSEGPVVVMCAHGERAMTAASVIQRAGRQDVSVLTGGPQDWALAHGRALETTG